MPFDVFISFSHKNRKIYNALAVHLDNLRNQPAINGQFEDAATKREPQILKYLHIAQIIFLLINTNFLDSQFCCIVKMTQALAKHNAKQPYIIPIIRHSIVWKDTFFAKLQAHPNKQKTSDSVARMCWCICQRGKGYQRSS